jgi:hypothetical protein
MKQLVSAENCLKNRLDNTVAILYNGLTLEERMQDESIDSDYGSNPYQKY